MTRVRTLRQINYLTPERVEIIYKVLFKRFKEMGESIPHFSLVNKNEIENVTEIPQQSFFGEGAYPTLESKAAIIFYKINKGHIFPNGNKRMSLICLFMFLVMNDKELDVSADEATNKAIEVAMSEAENFELVKDSLEFWVKSNIVDLK